MKVLITGPWLESSSEYSCLFDHISVPAALIQPGVLRCYCPGNTPACMSHFVPYNNKSYLYFKEKKVFSSVYKEKQKSRRWLRTLIREKNTVRSGGLTMSTVLLRIVFWDGRVSET